MKSSLHQTEASGDEGTDSVNRRYRRPEAMESCPNLASNSSELSM